MLKRILVLLLLAAVSSRVAVALFYGNWIPPAQDDNSYSTLAERLAAGYGYSFPRPWYPFTQANESTAFWSFAYPLFLAFFYRLAGVRPLIPRLAQACLGGVFLPYVLYRLAGRLFPRQPRLAVIAAGCAAFYAFFILYAARLLTETFYIVALLWSMECAIALAEEPSLSRATLLGLSLGLAALLRQSILPWVPVLFLWLLWKGWREGWLARAFRYVTLSSLVLLACILPFTIRNYLVYGEFLLLNSNAGYAFYSAQHPMHGTSFQAFAAAPLPEDLVGKGLNEAQLDRILLRRGLQFVLDDPVRYIKLSLSRVLDYFEFWPTDTSLLHNVGRLSSFTLFLPFFIYGIVLAVRSAGPLCPWRNWLRFFTTPLALVLLFMSFYSLLHILTWAMPRYRLPVDAVAMPFAALALDDLWARLRHLRHKLARRDREASDSSN